MSIYFKHREYPDSILNRSIWEILSGTELCAIATIQNKGRSYVNTAYFAYNQKLELFFLSDPESQHCINIRANSSVAVAVYNSRQAWARPKRGLQMFGTCSLAQKKKKTEAEYQYGRRFAGYKSWIRTLTKEEREALRSRFYVIRVSAVKIFDEPLFGEEVFIPLTLR